MVNLIQHIEESITNAIEGKSKLTPEILSMNGFSSSKIRHLLNNLLDIPDVNYLEIGVYKGSTFISALYQNKINQAHGFDNWSELKDINEDARTAFIINCATFGIIDYKLVEMDCFSFDITKIESKINVYFYDGHHSINSTGKSLTYFYDILADEFIYIVDDYDWEDPSLGVISGIEKANLEIVYKKHLKSNKMNDGETWWNGVGIFILRKK